jgi:hypothetical protein
MQVLQPKDYGSPIFWVIPCWQEKRLSIITVQANGTKISDRSKAHNTRETETNIEAHKPVEKTSPPLRRSRRSSILGNGYRSLMVTASSLLKSTQNLVEPSSFLISTTGDLQISRPCAAAESQYLVSPWVLDRPIPLYGFPDLPRPDSPLTECLKNRGCFRQRVRYMKPCGGRTNSQ